MKFDMWKLDMCKTIAFGAVAAMLIGLLCSCESRINQANFDKIEPGMTQEAVLAVLGEPTESSSMNLAGLSGTASEWTQNGTTISIQFLNGKVKFKHFSKTSVKKP